MLCRVPYRCVTIPLRSVRRGEIVKDETLIEPFAVQEFFVDGFDDYEVKDGILTCAGFRAQKASKQSGGPLRVVVLRIVMPVANLQQVIANATEAAKGMPMLELAAPRNGAKLAH